jgi:hypothetical protein
MSTSSTSLGWRRAPTRRVRGRGVGPNLHRVSVLRAGGRPVIKRWAARRGHPETSARIGGIGVMVCVI